jgi:hypothetical protein
MPIILKNIEARILDNFVGDINIFSRVDASVQFEDYIKLNAFTAYLQNFTKADSVTTLTKPLTFGLKNQYNLTVQTLDVSY